MLCNNFRDFKIQPPGQIAHLNSFVKLNDNINTNADKKKVWFNTHFIIAVDSGSMKYFKL